MKTKKDFKNILEELKSLKTQLSEDYIFNDENEMGSEMEPQEVVREPHKMDGQGGSEEEIAMHAQEIIEHEPIVGKIRETAIEGLRKYASHPTSELYLYFKSVFLDSDKLLTGKGK